MVPVKNDALPYECERRVAHIVRPDFRITELQLSATQKIPWHCHTNVRDTVYVLAGEIKLFLRDPKEEIRLLPAETYPTPPRRPHRGVNNGAPWAFFFLRQGIGAYDFVRLS